ncbi:hypothetical protein WJX75_005834 [Coccomyxa subellipsoidea]|uniref:Expansin-like EG45 domain-containing protein n=1 Tax=Coccomyxa subellipsoidea TaxID=248742 RepID=A0ABR2YD79_9CHLO
MFGDGAGRRVCAYDDGGSDIVGSGNASVTISGAVQPFWPVNETGLSLPECSLFGPIGPNAASINPDRTCSTKGACYTCKNSSWALVDLGSPECPNCANCVCTTISLVVNGDGTVAESNSTSNAGSSTTFNCSGGATCSRDSRNNSLIIDI